MLNLYTDLGYCNYICFSQDFTQEDQKKLPLIIDEVLDKIDQKKCKKIKLIFDTSIQKEVVRIVDIIQNKLFIVSDYQTNFFQTNRLDGFDLLSNWEDVYKKDFEVFDLKVSGQYHDEAKNLLCNSFGVCVRINNGVKEMVNDELRQSLILDNFENAISNESMYSFLIRSKEGEVVGLYSFYKFGDELHLCNVAGRSSLANSYKKPKIQIICSSLLDQFKSNSNFEVSNRLIFSSSKVPVAQMYLDLGFKKTSNRSGLVITSVPKTSN